MILILAILGVSCVVMIVQAVQLGSLGDVNGRGFTTNHYGWLLFSFVCNVVIAGMSFVHLFNIIGA
jgi:hypothetical protein